MVRFLVVIIVLGCVPAAPLSMAQTRQQNKVSSPSASDLPSISPSDTARGVPSLLPPLPPPPPGGSTVIGGTIRNVDLVRDRFTLTIYGGGKMNMLFDARTHIYLNGKRIPLSDLGPENHAAVQTVLDGTSIFAQSIHILSHAPEGEFQGQVRQYNPATGNLTLEAALSQEPIRLRVSGATSIRRIGQAASSGAAGSLSDLVKGTLITVEFQPGTKDRAVARQISILATPGSTFKFQGTIAFLDLHSKTLVVASPRDGKSYKISFDPGRFAVSRNLHQGENVTVTATFDGTAYVATAITAE